MPVTNALQCSNGTPHVHHTVEEVLVCYKLITVRTAPAAPQDGATDKQVAFVDRLGGDVTRARTMTRKACSEYIDTLLKGTAPVTTPTAPAPEPEPAKPIMPFEFLEMIRDGYYAAREDDQSEWKFFFVSRPKRGTYAGTIKVQMQHGSYYGNRWSEVAIGWPSKRVSIYRKELVEHIKLVIADQTGCGLAYAEQIGRCCRCNAELTDTRSRKYGIGPDCETHWPWIINEVDSRLALAEEDEDE